MTVTESQNYFGSFLARGKVMGVKRMYFGTHGWCEKDGLQMRSGGLWVCSSSWCGKGMMGRLCKNTLRAYGVIKERVCVDSFWLAKLLGNRVHVFTCTLYLYLYEESNVAASH